MDRTMANPLLIAKSAITTTVCGNAVMVLNFRLVSAIDANATATRHPFSVTMTHTLEFPECLCKFYDTINCISIVSNGVSGGIFDSYLVAYTTFPNVKLSLIRLTRSQHSTPWSNTLDVELICF